MAAVDANSNGRDSDDYKGERNMRTGLMNRIYLLSSLAFVMMLILPAAGFALETAPDGSTSTSMPSIQSDQADYPPGATVTLTGSNWQPGESVHINVNDTYGATWSRNVDVTADASGNITDSFNLPDYFVSDYDVTATGAQSGTVRTSFTDANPSGITVNPTSQTVIQGQTTNNYAVQVLMGGNANNCTTTLSASGLPTGATASFSGTNPRTGNTNYTSNLTVSTTNATPTGSHTFTVQMTRGGDCQGSGNFSQQLTLVVNPGNQAPVANNDSATTNEDNAINSINVLANDTDANGNTLSVSSFTQPTNGTVTKNADNTFKYVPNANFNGTDTFTYKANDGTVDSSNSATVTITVNSVNDAPSFTKGADQTVNEDAAAQTVTGWATAISRGPSNESTQTVSFTATNNNNSLFSAQPQVSSNGTLTYTPAANANGTATVTVTAKDSGGTANGGVDTSASQTFTITINSVNDAPVANNDSATTNEDTAKDIAVLANDTDPEGDSLSVSSFTQPSNGTVTQNADGTLKYTPNADFNGSDSFTYMAKDASLDSNSATVSLTVNAVNDAPVADAQSVTTDEDTAKAVTLSASDVEGNTLSYTIVSGPSHGTLSGTGATRTYTPAADYNGPDSFTYKANDGSLDSNVATVSITVTAVNDAPVAVDDTATTDEDTPVEIAANELLANDSAGPANESGQTLTIKSVSNGQNGQAALNTDGSVTFTPDANFFGEASFDYTVCDDGTPQKCYEGTATVKVTVNAVNDAPVAVNDSATTDEDTPKDINVITNDTDVDNTNAELSVSSFTQPSHGTVTQNADGTLKYTPNADYNGPDSFTYKAKDASLDSNSATVSLTVNAVNDAPVAKDDSATTNEDTAANGNVLTNDTDVDSANLTATQVAGPTHGTLIFNANGSYTYTPATNYNGPDSFTYKANDGSLDSNVATVSITVTAVNDAPVGTDDSYSTIEDTDLTVSAANGLLKNDTDIENDQLHVDDADASTPGINPVSGPSHGQLTLNADGSFTYKPNTDYNGADSFTYRVCDNGSPTPKCSVETANVNIKIDPVNDAPVAVNDTATTDEDTPKDINVITNDTDVDNTNAELSVSSFTQPSHGTVTQNADGTLKYTPNADYNGPDSFTYKAKDASLDSNSATVSLTVNAVNDAPVAKDDSATTEEDTAKDIAVLANDTDVEGNTLSVSSFTQPSHGTVSQNADGTLKYVPSANYNGPDSFTYKAKDASADSNSATVRLTVNAVNDAPTVTLSGPATAYEGDTNTYNFAVSDPDSGDTFTVKSGFPDCGTGGVYIASSLNTTASGGSFGCRFPEGPANPTVRIQVTDGQQADSNVATKDVTVANVNPTIGPLAVSGNSGTACIGSTNVVKLSFLITDPGSTDTHSGTINWGDGTTTQFNGSSVTDAQHSYSAGTYTITVNASDDDGGNASPKTTAGSSQQVSLRYNVSQLLEPVNPAGMTMSVFKHGSTVSLKVIITDCNNQPVNGLVPKISFTKVNPATPVVGVNEGVSTQPNDTNYLMRDAGNGQYIYNLNTRSLADGDATYNATITDSKATSTAPATYGPKTSQNFGLRSK